MLRLGSCKGLSSTTFNEVWAIREDGGFGSIIDRNSFQRDRKAALNLLDNVIGIYEEDKS